MSQDETQGPERGNALERLVFFSDAIFAISITLLVLPLAETHLTEDEAPRQLAELMPEVSIFALSFAVIGMFWLQHHRYFRDIAAFDSVLLRLNLGFLFCIVFMPFPTAALGRAGGSGTVTALYAGTIAVTSSMSALMWWYASRDGGVLLVDGIPRARVRHRLAGASVSILVFAASIPIALFVDANAAKYSWIATLPLSLLLDRFSRRPDGAAG